MISDETWDLIREAWKAGIPEQYRFTDRERRHGSQYLSTGPSIILPKPPAPLLAKFFTSIRMHLTAKQMKTRPVNRADAGAKAPGSRIRKSKARTRPSPPPSPPSAFLAFTRP